MCVSGLLDKISRRSTVYNIYIAYIYKDSHPLFFTKMVKRSTTKVRKTFVHSKPSHQEAQQTPFLSDQGKVFAPPTPGPGSFWVFL